MKLTLVSKNDVGDGVVSFTFSPETPVNWIAGQSIRLEIPCGYGSDERRFTISSAPFEQHITISTRISSSTFKQALEKLPIGASVSGYGIDGTFILPDTGQSVLLVAVGVGITPYISMLKQQLHQARPQQAILLFANQRQDFPFANDIQALQRTNEALRVIWETHRISASMVAGYASPSTLIYLSGPEKMVSLIAAELTEQFQIPKEHIKQDLFTGQSIG